MANGIFDSILDPIFGTDSSGDSRRARKYLDEMYNIYNNLNIPELPTDLQFEGYTYEGDITPQTISARRVDPVTAQAIAQADTEMKTISVDPALREQQLQGLMELQRIYQEGGLSPEDRAALSRIQSEAAQADRGRREAIMQNMAARGMGGSGMELLAQLQSSQAATDRAAQQGLDVAAQANARKLQALMQAGNLAGGIRAQDFGEQAQIAAAQDAINRFNAANETGVNQFNAGVINSANQFNVNNATGADIFSATAHNDAQYANRGVRQNISNAGVDARNRALEWNKIGAPQAQFGMESTAAQGQAQAAGHMSDYWQGEAAKKADRKGNVISGILEGATAWATKSDERKKKNISKISDSEIREFLASLDPKKFEYKDEKDGQGEYVGVMAQDLLRTEPGSKMVFQDENGDLGYDMQKMQGMTLAAIKFLADQIQGKKK